MTQLRITSVASTLVMSLLISVPVFAEQPMAATYTVAQNAPPSGGGKPAAGGKAGAAGGKERTHTLSFEDELVEGANAKPELFYLFQKKNFNYKRLIKLRENFIPEMRKTSEEVQRGRSPN